MTNKIISSYPVQRFASWLESFSNWRRYSYPKTKLNKDGHGYIVYERTLLGNILWYTHPLRYRAGLAIRNKSLTIFDTPKAKLMLEYKLADLWIGAFWRHNPIYTVNTPEAFRDFCEKRFNLVPVHYYRLEIWVCILPVLPLHFTFVIPNRRQPTEEN